jgi:hypothetical protein
MIKIFTIPQEEKQGEIKKARIAGYGSSLP